jgi:hypothetical protein
MEKSEVINETKTDKTLSSLFEKNKKLKVPAYQRAYAWEEKQLSQFISDMLEFKDKDGYYYGHFILEESMDYLEIIDGQQRITTFVLFLMVCRLYNKDMKLDDRLKEYINCFETVDYDQKFFKAIQNNLKEKEFDKDWQISDFPELNNEQQTQSILRILFALNYFKNAFKSEKAKVPLKTEEIDKYIKTLTSAHISTHITNSKAVGVQIFEMQNTRGIQLTLMEKVKSKLMKALYLNSDGDSIIHIVHNNFAEIYRLEENVISKSFRGELTLDDIFFHHLRIVDDGSKLDINKNSDKNSFDSPGKSGNKEDVVLTYLTEQISNKKGEELIKYITNLSNKFKETVSFISRDLPELDKAKPLIGDVLILEKDLSLEFFILLFHKGEKSFFEKNDLLKLWEILLFIRDFHDRYYRMWYKDDFEKLFFDSIKCENIENLLNKYLLYGFRPDRVGNNLPKTVKDYIKSNKENILNNAFYWWTEKMVYTLYKYEISKGACFESLRKIMKEGRSVEHILPQEWQREWIDEKDINNISENGNAKAKEIGKIINGIGNLLLVTRQENSKCWRNHPADKIYNSCSGGSYQEHNENRAKWSDYNNWNKLIQTRGEKIFDFLWEYFFSNLSDTSKLQSN